MLSNDKSVWEPFEKYVGANGEKRDGEKRDGEIFQLKNLIEMIF